jgi:hypothetical protein
VVNLPQKKFIYIMRHFVSGVFSYIDIAMRNFSAESATLKARHSRRNVYPGQIINLADLIVTDVPIGQIEITSEDSIDVDVNEGTVYSNVIGVHRIHFLYNGVSIYIDLDVKDPTPRFSLSRSVVKAQEGSSINLKQFINQSSIVNININDKVIRNVTSETVIKNGIFTNANHPGVHVISFSYDNEDYPIVNNLQIDLQPLRIREAKKFKDIFPNYQNISEYFKILDIINDIS